MKKLILKLKKIKPEFFYRLALGSTYIFLGYEKLIAPGVGGDSFIKQPFWFKFIKENAGLEELILILAVVEIFLGTMLLLWFLQYKYIRNITGFIFVYAVIVFWLTGMPFSGLITPLLALGLFFEYWRRR